MPYEALIIPLYYQLRSLGLTDTYWALILPQSALSLAFGVYWMRGFFRSVPRSYLETAWIEGASSWRLLWEILVPLARPAIATMVILSFMWNWNEFLLPVVMISDSDHATAPLALANFQGRFDVNIAELTAAAIIVALPIIVLYIVLQRRFLAAVVQGGKATEPPTYAGSGDVNQPNACVTITGPRAVAVVTGAVPEPAPDEVLIRTRFSGISAGTEMNVYRGTAPQWQHAPGSGHRASSSADEPEWSYPLVYGYANVGTSSSGWARRRRPRGRRPSSSPTSRTAPGWSPTPDEVVVLPALAGPRAAVSFSPT